MIDLRSDTVTKPTPNMLKAMLNAAVGDDVYGEDPSIKALEEKTAAFFGMEAALFCPSGTMANQIAIKVHTQAGDEIICHEYAHIYNYEGGGVAFNAACQMRFLKGNRGLMNPQEVEAAINNPHDIHAAPTSLIAVENTCNKGGGSCYTIENLKAIGDIAKKHQLQYHMDGARIFNALIAKKQDPKEMGRLFHSMSVCLSKGLGCPVGSVLLGSKDFISKALRIRKRLGGGMRQAGFLAAAGIYALDHHIDRLEEDHAKAKVLENALKKCTLVASIDEVETNIVIFYLKEIENTQAFIKMMQEKGILMAGMGQGKLRFVTHLDVSMNEINILAQTLQHL